MNVTIDQLCQLLDVVDPNKLRDANGNIDRAAVERLVASIPSAPSSGSGAAPRSIAAGREAFQNRARRVRSGPAK